MEIRALTNTGSDELYEAFQKAFEEYELQLNREQLQKMLIRRGFTPQLSFAAFDKGRIAAFTLNGIGTFSGLVTAYDTGTGTLKEYRGRGLATRVFEYSIPFLKRSGVRQYLLEVLQHNTAAVSVNRKLGFEVSREFNYSNQLNSKIGIGTRDPDNTVKVTATQIDEICRVEEFWDFTPSWQNGFESIRRSLSDFVCMGAFIGEHLIGYCIFEPFSGDITQIAVAREHRGKGIASRLLAEAIRLNPNDAIKIINTDISCVSMNNWLEARNIELRGKQFEMMKKL